MRTTARSPLKAPPSSVAPSTSGCTELTKRQLKHSYPPTAGGIYSLTDLTHSQFGRDAFGGTVAYLSDADDPLEPSLFEAEPYGGRTSGKNLGTEKPVNPASSPVNRTSAANKPEAV
ncbi:hypothetical protein GCM10023205_82480 [Yinghuangia aomiensis]|uniref:Uncharacterized protein n=1 Tax=Yinghuangia aomiensis TaxID=676205 RepID=A0ABP9IFF2_9ACTN